MGTFIKLKVDAYSHIETSKKKKKAALYCLAVCKNLLLITLIHIELSHLSLASITRKHQAQKARAFTTPSSKT